jgi:hypothetical protein
VARSADSAADRELTARLAARGLTGSGARYERWRRAGLLPGHERHGAGRGRGSVSALDPATVEIAAALARHAAQGRDLRAAVVAWFFEAGRPVLPGQLAVPEPPDAAVIEALAWAVRTDPVYRLVRRARSVVTQAQADDFYAAATEHARREAGAATGFDPSLVHKVAGRDAELVSSGAPRDLVHLVAAMGLGAEEVGPEAIAATGYFPQMSVQEWRDAMIEAFASGAYAEELAALSRFDPASAVESAGIERLRGAREVAIGLAGIGALMLMHGLLMPDTPGLAALRAGVDELGAGPLLVNLARQVMHPAAVASAVANCLNPAYSSMYRSLSELIAADPPLLHQAGGDKHDPEAFMQTWISSIEALASRSSLTAGP